jgi:hypothetical protein
MSRRFCSLLAFAVACSTTGVRPNASVDSQPSSESTSGATTAEARAAKAEKARRLGCKTSSSGTNAAVSAAEAGNPHSVDFRGRDTGTRSPSNAEIDAAETVNPASVDFGDRVANGTHSPSNDEIDAAETGNPHSADNTKQADRSHAATKAQIAADCNALESAKP